ncbi:MAG: 50S ribosomal protein L30 [Deltaproteobacteria bacterium RIFCSPLOWO2_02_FULL_50_16]|nr:MAG: 50S ribosomal protein L30 [Deltaproteobacteria bacterium GWA2_50_8]OGQ26918.1 MAG: 50S ribosomal protein L30 [Deltaproteobacteria bacterium RIFCSPHIGHO2_02_FULL_50_15]OGQ56180.1 MAG: 50S ribosomal protein L30 [Deltaproteobacteria bacterium RIFCSPLOWO2_02_FULL_50_16]OGQ67037.1 MAG: 50S ribosomal protein L30 [Deltaproteobacteria bacterium RIFCSPLOWO2_12_FULL_50_11]
MQYLKVKLVYSAIGCSERQRRVVAGLGLKWMGHEKFLNDTDAIRGMVSKVAHLVSCESVDKKPVLSSEAPKEIKTEAKKETTGKVTHERLSKKGTKTGTKREIKKET